MKTDSEYQEDLTAHVFSLLGNGPLDFMTILKGCNGAYPSVVKSTLCRLEASGEIKVNDSVYFLPNDVRITATPSSAMRDIESAQDSDAITHPADYDWRFSRKSVIEIVQDIKKHYSIDQTAIGLFGVTSLFEPLTDLGFDTVLFNKSKYLLNEIELRTHSKGLIEHDLFFPLQTHRDHFDLVIADPPWYIEYYSAFLLRATETLKVNGELHLSVFQRFTRPEAGREREAIIEYARNLGFELKSLQEQYFKYSTPTFEKLALQAEGIILDRDWRTGDRFIFSKVHPFTSPLRPLDANYPQELWDDFLLRKKRIKLRRRREFEPEIFSFTLVDEIPTLRTVSRRYPKRNLIDIWTSDNAAYSVTGIAVLREALILLDGNKSTVNEAIEKLTMRYPSMLGLDKLKELLEQL